MAKFTMNKGVKPPVPPAIKESKIAEVMKGALVKRFPTMPIDDVMIFYLSYYDLQGDVVKLPKDIGVSIKGIDNYGVHGFYLSNSDDAMYQATGAFIGSESIRKFVKQLVNKAEISLIKKAKATLEGEENGKH